MKVVNAFAGCGGTAADHKRNREFAPWRFTDIWQVLVGKTNEIMGFTVYLEQALFTCQVCTHSTTKLSLFYLLYGKQP
jgi:hypothetical protein